MSLTSPKNKTQLSLRGFTMVELLLVIVIIGIIGVYSFTSLARYHITTVLDSELKIMVANARSARQNATGNDTNSSYGIKFLTNSYVVFKGTSYNENDVNNRVYSLNSLVIVSTTFSNNLVIFNRYDGRVTNTGSVTISAAGLSKVLTINSLGIVEYSE